MNKDRPVLVLGATGRTGSRVAAVLADRGRAVRAASRHGSPVHFDWDAPATFAPALDGVGAVYLVAPVLRVDYPDAVADFLDRAEQAGVAHVTYLSAYGADQAGPESAIRAVELDLQSRTVLTHSMIRPAWFMQNFTESFLVPRSDTIAVPTGAGAEAFVHADDIAAVAAATLADPSAHAGAAYAPAGPEALTMAEAAHLISTAAGRTISYHPIDQDAWIDAMLAAGVPRDYVPVLRRLTATVAAGDGARPTDDVQRVTGRPPIPFAAFAAGSTWTRGARP